MPDNETPEVAGGEQINPESQTPTPGEQEAPAATPTQETTPEQPKELFTAEQLEFLAQREANLKREVKKSNKTRADQIQKEVNAIKTTMEKRGAPLTEQQVAVISEQVEESLDQMDEQPSSQTPIPQAQDLHPLASIAFPVFEEEGIAIEEGDPEYEKIKPFLKDPKPSQGKVVKFSNELYKQIEAKKQRIASQKDKAAVRSPGGGGPQPSGDAPAKSASELWAKAYKN
jgi:hypothetical protein